MEDGVPETKEAIMKALSMLDKAAEKGVLHANNAARRKGRLMKQLAALGAAPASTAEAESAEEPKKTAKK
jgi:ribosomal protein S20